MLKASGQVSVVSAGTAVVLGSQRINAPLMIKAKPGNTGNVFVGNNGNDSVSSTTGLILAKGDAVVFQNVTDLSQIYVDAATNADGVSWLVLAF